MQSRVINLDDARHAHRLKDLLGSTRIHRAVALRNGRLASRVPTHGSLDCHFYIRDDWLCSYRGPIKLADWYLCKYLI